MKEAKQTEADVYMYEKHTRTLTSTPRTLLKPSDSETGNGERFAVWARVDYTQSYVELLRATVRLVGRAHCLGLCFAVPGVEFGLV